MPASMAAGKPTANRLSCGAERASRPITICTSTIAKATGKRDREAGGEQHARRNKTRCGCSRRSARHRPAAARDSFRRSIAASIRWPPMARNRKVARITRNWPSTGFCWPSAGSTSPRNRGPSRCRSPRRRAGAEKPICTAKPMREPGHHLAGDQHEAGIEASPSVGSTKAVSGERRNADRERDDQPQLDRHEGGAEDRRGEEGGARADHRHQPEPELRLDAGEPAGIISRSRGYRRTSSCVKSTSSAMIEPPKMARQTPTTISLGTKVKSLLVDRGRRLDHAEHQAGDQSRDQDRRGGEREDPERLLGDADEIIADHRR